MHQSLALDQLPISQRHLKLQHCRNQPMKRFCMLFIGISTLNIKHMYMYMCIYIDKSTIKELY